MDIRDNIRSYIRDRGLIQAVLARRAGMTPAKLSAALTKRRGLEANEFIRLCEAMGVSMEEMRNYNSKSA